ncbi:hypothetical protein DB30_00542 [Enhygromyxa salina]|uniref:FG-GAP repeat protein n=1 Tax=Enhygromyxa salina TaxID=215803 RepID=A0A0C2CYY8_9BACT|nr:hypothetical protein DB30_00542 [Enhygromyxa salina]
MAAFAASFGLGACFDGLDAAGLPCTNDNQCGPKSSCIEGFCGGLFACDDGERISEDALCDGTVDCPDGSDEAFERCFADAEPFECDDGGVVPLESICNDTSDCADGSDESPVMCAGVGVNSCEAAGGDLGYELGPAREAMPDPRGMLLANLIGSESDDAIVRGDLGNELRVVSFDETDPNQERILEGFGTSKIVDFELGELAGDPMLDLVVATTSTDDEGTDAGVYVFSRASPMSPPELVGAPSTLPGLLDAQIVGIELGNFDGDETSDIVLIVDGAVKGRAFVGVGDSAAGEGGGAFFEFAPLESFALDYETFLDSAMTDLDNDGDSDLLVTSITDGKGVLWVVRRSGQDGEGEVEWDAPAQVMLPFPGRELAVGRFSSTMALSDDVVILDTMSGDLRTLINQNGTLMPQPPLPAVEGSQVSGLTLADMNCDGNADYLINVGSPAEVRVYLGDGSGGLLSEDPIIYASDGAPRGALGVLHADGDSTPDIVSAVEPGGEVSTGEVRLLVTANASN